MSAKYNQAQFSVNPIVPALGTLKNRFAYVLLQICLAKYQAE
jgi:hypothetical protein